MTEIVEDKTRQCWEKIEEIVRHKERVRTNILIIAEALCERGECDLARTLVAEGYAHDNSKFFGVEFEYLGQDSNKNRLELAIHHHNSTNKHHPEAWSGINNMPRLYIAELVCDWCARASEFGTSVREWIETGAKERFGFEKKDRVYKEIMFFVDLLCDKPFKPVKPKEK